MPKTTESVRPTSPALPAMPRSAGALSYESEESVCGNDERELAIDTQGSPYYGICRLSIQMDSGGYVGSGFLVATGSSKWDVVVTSGHCVHAKNEGFAQSITVIPGATQTSHPYGSFKVDAANVRASEEWKAHGENQADYDYGVILLPKTGTLGALGLWVASDAELQGRRILNAGYPGDKTPYGNLWEMAGPITAVDSHKVHYLNDTSGGQSGSPAVTLLDGVDWSDWSKVRVIGVHGYGGCPNSAVRITDAVFAQIVAWSNS